MVLKTVIILCLICGTQTENVNKLTLKLLKKIEDSQVKTGSEYIPFFSWQKDVGVYDSEVKLNSHGPSNLAFVRDNFKVFDNNMFVTTWVTSCLLEAYRYGGVPKPPSSQLQSALSAINQYRSRNEHFQNSIMSFWPQIYNKSSSTYISSPTNLLNLMDITNVLPIRVIEDLLKKLGFVGIEKLIKELLSEKDMFKSAFHIPPDFDDTFVNLGLGAFLTDQKDDFPMEQLTWLKSNTNITSVFDALKKYAYRPFSSNSNLNTIDPRSYFYLRSFLEEALTSSCDLALIPTWVQDIDETRVLRSKGVSMPFNINNIDVTVSANVIYGITASILSGLVSPEILNDVEVKQIYLNTTNMIAHAMKTDLSQRRDLALTYYPSVFEFYWFVARTVFLLNEKSMYSKLPHKDLTIILSTLEPILEGHVTNVILKQAQSQGTNMSFFDDFLGDGDVDDKNQTEVKAEDRIFTTSMAVNALIATWSTFDEKTNKLNWKKGVSSSVKSLVTTATNWLKEYTLSGDFKPWNTFFSGSVKGSESFPFYFPINRLEYFNGTKITDYNNFPSGGPFIIGLQGVIPKDSYDRMVYDEEHFGVKTPTKFTGFNSGDGYFPFWSSEPYTYAITLLALSQSDNFAN